MHKKIIKFGISGGLAAAVHFSVLIFLTEVFGLWPVAATSIAFIPAAATSFMLQKFWTFEDTERGRIHFQFALYFATGVGAFFLNALYMYVFFEALGVHYLIAQFLSTALVAFYNFVVYGKIFKKGKKGNPRLLIATGIFPPDIGGPATYSKLLSLKLPSRGFEISVLSFGDVRKYPSGIRHGLYFLKVLRRGIFSDIIFAQDPVSTGLPAYLAATLLGKHFALKVVGDFAWEQYQNREQKIQNKKFITPEEFQEGKYDSLTERQKKIERFVARGADMVIVPSRYLKKIVLAWGVSESRIRVIYNAFDGGIPVLSKEEARKETGISGYAMLSVGRLVPWKGFGELIDVFSDIAKEKPDARLYIAGDGPGKDSLLQKINNAGLDGSVTLLGKMPRKDILTALKAADLFVLNTGYEGFSHQLLEALGAGTPVITTRVGGNTELIEHGKNGILVPYGDKGELKETLRKIISGEINGVLLAREGLSMVARFSEEDMLKETARALNGVLN